MTTDAFNALVNREVARLMAEADMLYSLEQVEATCDWYDHLPFDSEEQAENHAEELRLRYRGAA